MCNKHRYKYCYSILFQLDFVLVVYLLAPMATRYTLHIMTDYSVSVINTATNTVIATIPVCDVTRGPYGLYYSPDGNKDICCNSWLLKATLWL